jgi:phospholipase/lecithinase/hemolysin
MMRKRQHWAVPGFSALVLLALAACSGGGGGGGGLGTPSSGTSEPPAATGGGGSSGGGGGSTGDTADGGTGSGSTGGTAGGTAGSGGSTSGGSTGGSTGGGTIPTPPPPAVGFATPNLYATVGSDTPNRLRRLTVFGDSYSDTNSRFRTCGNPGVIANCTPRGQMWSERLVASGSGATLRSYARDGASALDGGVYAPNDNDFKSQVDQWAAGPDLGANDLTIVYMGYNDVNARSGQDASIADYATQVDRLIRGGATASERRLFLTLLHDFGTVPSSLGNPAGGKGARTQAMNSGIAGIVNGKANVVAVDMFTVFNRIRANPARYGLTNVTGVAGPGDDLDTFLYADAEHFSPRGQELVAQVYNHYLTRGWDLANSLQGNQANRNQLNNDVDNRLAQLSLIEGGAAGFTSYFVGDEAAAMGAFDLEMGDPSRSGFAQLTQAGRADAGIGLNYALDTDTRLGVVMSRYGSDQTYDLGADATRLDTASDTVSVYVDSKLGGIDLRTRASFANDSYEKATYNEVVDEANSVRHGGRTMSISQTASKALRVGNAWLQPWVNVTHSEQQIDGYTISNPFVSDLTYSDATVTDTVASLGLNATSDRFTLGGGTTLTLTGGLSYTRSLRADDYEVTIKEAAMAGLKQTETVEREGAEMIGLRLGSALEMGESLSLSTDYAFTKQMGVEADHSVTARFNYRF